MFARQMERCKYVLPEDTSVACEGRNCTTSSIGVQKRVKLSTDVRETRCRVGCERVAARPAEGPPFCDMSSIFID